MNITIGNYVIRADALSVNLYERYVVTGENTRGREAKPESIGQTRERVVGYYARLDQALAALLEHVVGTSDAETVADLKATMERCAQQVAAAASCFQLRSSLPVAG